MRFLKNTRRLLKPGIRLGTIMMLDVALILLLVTPAWANQLVDREQSRYVNQDLLEFTLMGEPHPEGIRLYWDIDNPPETHGYRVLRGRLQGIAQHRRFPVKSFWLAESPAPNCSFWPPGDGATAESAQNLRRCH